MANALASPHIFEIAFDALTAAVGGLIILPALRVAPALTLSAHRLALQISIVAAVLIIAAQMAEVWADFSRLSTIKDAAADVAELTAVCFVGLALHLMGRAEKEEISSLRRAANVDHLTGLLSRFFFHRAAERRIELYKRNGLPLACAVLDVGQLQVV
jgi:predicted signal transduction protein with EAL and GGDEF domain